MRQVAQGVAPISDQSQRRARHAREHAAFLRCLTRVSQNSNGLVRYCVDPYLRRWATQAGFSRHDLVAVRVDGAGRQGLLLLVPDRIWFRGRSMARLDRLRSFLLRTEPSVESLRQTVFLATFDFTPIASEKSVTLPMTGA